MANSPLAPVAQPPAPKAPGEIPVNKIKVPQGFKVELWAYQNRAFLAQRGAWNRTQKTGYRVMMVTLRPSDVPKYEVFAEGFLENNQPWGRPVYTTHMKDGSILLSDDYAGAIYRISYSR
jgi:glucose/arabinose dehydrogenase